MCTYHVLAKRGVCSGAKAGGLVGQTSSSSTTPDYWKLPRCVPEFRLFWDVPPTYLVTSCLPFKSHFLSLCSPWHARHDESEDWVLVTFLLWFLRVACHTSQPHLRGAWGTWCVSTSSFQTIWIVDWLIILTGKQRSPGNFRHFVSLLLLATGESR